MIDAQDPGVFVPACSQEAVGNASRKSIPRRGTSRPTVERMMYLARLLRRGWAVNAIQAARTLEVSPKTVRRDMQFMRDRLGYDYTFDASLNTFRLSSAPKPML